MDIGASGAKEGSNGMFSTFDGTEQACNLQYDIIGAAADISIIFMLRLSADWAMGSTFQNMDIMEFTSAGLNRSSVAVRQQGAGAFYLWGENHGPFNGIESSQITVNTYLMVQALYLIRLVIQLIESLSVVIQGGVMYQMLIVI